MSSKISHLLLFYYTECRTRKGSEIRKINKDTGFNAVFGEQFRQQYQNGFVDGEKLAAAYYKAGTQSREAAYNAAKLDAEAVLEQRATVPMDTSCAMDHASSSKPRGLQNQHDLVQRFIL